MRIGIDMMGSENAPELLFDGILQAARCQPEVKFLALATLPVAEKFQNYLSQLPGLKPLVELQIVKEVVEMTDEPLLAIRKKKQSSLLIGMRLLKKNAIRAFVSAGNTGALIASAALSLPLLPEIRRPALLATLPTKLGYVVVIDVGGNVSCKSRHLIQFALMGAAYQRCCHGIQLPKVGLLNIGVESKKGTSELRQAYETLEEMCVSNSFFSFVGNVEGREVFEGKADVIVTDGFTGNVLLKTSEGVSFFILEHLQEALKDISPSLRSDINHYFKNQFDPDEYPGAIVCGVDRVLVKCHGKSSAKGICNGILGAIELVKHRFTDLIKAELMDKRIKG